ncbi:MAG: endonuclease/exonuclease/phosphatase family protein, partial [Planctomycetota bacterium]
STYPGAACPRIATWCVLRDARNDGTRLLVLNTHWDHVSAEARQHSAELIRTRLPELADEVPTIVMGDLNVGESQLPIQKLLGSGEERLTDSYRAVHRQPTERERTFHGFNGGDQGVRIDYVLHNSGLRPLSAEIDRTAYDGVFPSDHYPVTATLEFVSE